MIDKYKLFLLSICSLLSLQFKNSSFQELVNWDQLSPNIKEEITNSKKLVVHYFDGSCSSCIGQMIELDLFFQDSLYQTIPIIFVSPLSDSTLINFYAEKANLSSTILYDQNDTFYELNRNFFETYGDTFIIDHNGNICANGNPMDDSIVKQSYVIATTK